jgi:hypothetical protein
MDARMETTRFDQEWTNVDVTRMCIHAAAAIGLATTLGMGVAQLLDDPRTPTPAVTSSPDASSPGA